MMGRLAYEIEPWHIREKELALDQLGQSESIFALSNGHIGLRGNLDEGEPHGLPGTYLNSFYELRPLPYAEAGYGFPESGQSIINVSNGKLIRLLVDDEPFDVRYGELRSHERVLDLRAGTLHRELEWVSPAGDAVKVRSTRLVSFTHRAVAACSYEVEAVDEPLRLIVQSELVANEQLPTTRPDPRVEAALDAPLVSEEHLVTGSGGLLVHHTRATGLRMAAAMDHVIEGPERVDVRTEAFPDWVRTTVACVLQPGERLRIVKMLAYGWSSRRSLPALRDQVGAALTSARYAGWDGLCREQRQYLDGFWDAADVQLDGDPEIQQAVRLALFHVLQAGARAENRSIPAKGLTGPGYDGHIFWDTEMLMAPVLTYTQPGRRDAHPALAALHPGSRPGAGADARSARRDVPLAHRARAGVLGVLAGRHGRLPQQRRDRGRDHPLRQRHRRRGVRPGGRPGTAGGDGPAVVLAGPPRPARHVPPRRGHRARRVHRRGQGQPVHEPDGAAEPGRRGRRRASATRTRPRELGVTDDEVKNWQVAAAAMHIPYDEELRVHQQCDGFTRLQEWDFANTPHGELPAAAELPVLRHLPEEGHQAAGPGAGDAVARRRVHGRGEGPQLRVLRAVHGAGLVAVLVFAGGARGRGRSPQPGARLPGRGRADRPARPQRTTPRTGCTWPRSPGRGTAWCTGTAACATTVDG